MARGARSRRRPRTAGDDAVRGEQTAAPSGTSSSSSTKTAPRSPARRRRACCARSGGGRTPARRSGRAPAPRCRSPAPRRRRTTAARPAPRARPVVAAHSLEHRRRARSARSGRQPARYGVPGRQQRLVGRVDDGPHDGDGAVGGLPRAEPRPTPCRRRARRSAASAAGAPPRERRGRRDRRARDGPSARPAQLAGEERGGGHRERRPCRPSAAHLGRDHQIAGASSGASPPAKPATTRTGRPARPTAAAAGPRPRSGARPVPPCARPAPPPRCASPAPGSRTATRRAAARACQPDRGPHRAARQVAAEGRDREHLPVEVVVDVEVAREAGAGELGSSQRRRPAACRRASRRPRSAHGVAALAGGEQRQQRPRRLRCGGLAAAAPRRVVVRAQVLAPAAVGVLVVERATPRPAGSRVDGRRRRPRPAPGRPRRCRRRSWRPTARTRNRRAPAPRAASARRAGTPAESRRALGGQELHHVRGDVRGRRVDDLAEVAERQLRRPSSRVLSASNAPQPPSRLCMPAPATAASTPPRSRPARGCAGAPQRQHDLGGVVGVRVVVVLELERPAAGRQPGPAYRPVARHAGSPRRAASGAASRAGSSGGTPASASAISASAVSHTGDWQASSRRTGRRRVSRTVKRSSPSSPASITGWSSGIAEQVQREQRVDPRRLDAAPRAVGLLAGEDPLGGPAHRQPRADGRSGRRS